MRIVIDLQACQSGSRLGGIGRYSLALAKAIAAERGPHDVFVVLGDFLPLADFDVRMEFDGLLEPERILTFSAPGPVAANDPANTARKRVAELLREEFLRRLRPDIVHVGSLVEGWGEDVATSIGDGPLARRTTVTWYDLIPYVQPEMYLRDKDLAAHYYAKVAEAKKAGMLLAISQYSRDEAVRELGLAEDSVVNVSAGVDGFFRPVEVREEKRRKLLDRLGIVGPFLMYTGSFDVRKNQAGLIEAFARLPAAVRDTHQLVIVGNGWEGVYASLRDVARRANLPEHRLVFTGIVSDDELLELYNLTKLFVFPSLREGFGLPALEAMACGAAAIGSHCTSVPEVIGRDDALFDPTDVDAIAAKITAVVTNEGFLRSLREHAVEHSKRFSWRLSARRAIEAMETLSARTSPAHDADGYRRVVEQVADVAARAGWQPSDLAFVARSMAWNEARTNRSIAVSPADPSPRVGWVTTWGTRCGIASYSRFLIESAPRRAAAILAQTGCPATSGGPCDAPVIPCWKPGNDDSLHALAEQIDARGIDALVIQFNYGFFHFPSFNAFLTEQAKAGRAVILVCHSTTDPAARILPKKLADLGPGLAVCDRVLVHAPKDVTNLKRIGIERNVSLFPHGIVAVAPPNAPSGAGRGEFVLATYGFFLPHKGLPEMVEAFGRLARGDKRLRLRMVNAEYSRDASAAAINDVRDRVRALGLEDRVTLITDYLPDEESLRHLAAADLIVFPYQHTGESSSAAVRIGLASGRPVAVTPLPIFDDVSTVVHRLPGADVDSLVGGIGGLVERIRSGADEDLLAVARAAAEWCESRAYPRVSAHLHALIDQLAGGRTGAA